MMVCKLTGLQYHQWDKVKESIGPKNIVTIEREPKYDKPEGLAYRASYGGFVIGYIPLVDTLRGYWHVATTDEEKSRISQWEDATDSVRAWLDSQVKYRDKTEWSVPVWDVLYKDEVGYNTKGRGNPVQISLAFEEVQT